jgi:uncharacterized membrane protein
MLVPLPIGLWIFALVADIVYVAGLGGEGWTEAARFAVGVGIVGALLAAVPGLIDLVSLRDPAPKKIALWHMVLNLSAVAVFVLNFYQRWQREPATSPPLLLTVIGVVLIFISGWLGGELVYVGRVAVEEDRR